MVPLRVDISEANLVGFLQTINPGSYVWSGGTKCSGLEVAPNGIIYSSEHGPTTDDELNILEPNKIFGWPNVQGFVIYLQRLGFGEYSVVEL